MRLNARRQVVAALAAFMFVAPLLARAQSDELYAFEVRYVGALNDARMHDYAELQLQLMSAAHPGKLGQIAVLRAENLRRRGKKAEALEILQAVGAGAAGFASAQFALVKLVDDDRVKLGHYQQYFRHKKEADLATRNGGREYLAAVSGLAELLLEVGKPADAQKALALLQKLPRTSKAQDRQIKLVKAEISLGLVDAMRDSREPLAKYQPMVVKIEKDLDELLWEQDILAAHASGELVHARVLLQKPALALQTYDDAKGVCKNWEKALVKDKRGLQHSPMARLRYYRAEASFEQARQARDAQKKAEAENAPDAGALKLRTKDALKTALLRFHYVVAHYGEAKKFSRRALSRRNLLRDILEKRYQPIMIKFPDTQERAQRFELALGMFQDKRYAEAAKLFTDIAIGVRRWGETPKALSFAAICQYKLKHYLEAAALSDYMIDNYRDAEDTVRAVRNVAIAMQSAAKALARQADGKEHAKMLAEDANVFFTKFVELDPTHPDASSFASKVAGHQFARAVELRREYRRLQSENADPAAVAAARNEMTKAFRQAIPLFESITENHGASEFGVSAFYKLGWIYQVVGDAEDAASNFLYYCDVQKEPTQEKAEAKSLAALRLMDVGEPEDATTHFLEFLEWTKPGGTYEQTDKIKRLVHDAKAMLPWCYDQQANALRVKLADLKNKLRVAEEEAVPAKEAPPANDAGDEQEQDPAEEDAGEAAAPAANQAVDAEAIKESMQDVQAQVAKLRQLALAAFESYLKEFPSNPLNAPQVMLKLGIFYGEDGQTERSAKILEDLQKRFPESKATEQALFSLFRVLIDTNQLGKAKQLGKKLIEQLPNYSLGNLSVIAGTLFTRDERLNHGCLDHELALAVLREIMRRGTDAKHQDHARAKNVLDLTRYRIGLALYVKGEYDEAASKAHEAMQSNPDSPNLWDLYLLRALCFKELERPRDTLVAVNKLLAYVNKEKHSFTYHWAVLTMGQALANGKDQKSVKQAVARFFQIVSFVDLVDQPELRPVVEAAYLGLSQAHAVLGQRKEADSRANEYLTRFTNGLYRKEIRVLPPAKF